MKLFAASILLSLFAEAACADPRIIGGSNAPEGAYPYVASLQYPIHSHFCTGSIVNRRWILTAAHCIDDFSHYSVTVMLGATDIADPDADYYRSEYLVYHEYFNHLTLAHDIGIVRVERDILFSYNLQPIALPTKDFRKDNQTADFTGWGFDSHPGAFLPTTLQCIQLAVISVESCRSQFHRPHMIAPSHVCTLNPAGEGICSGDSGGPLVVDGVQIGIASFSKKGECAVGHPEVFTRVYAFRDWINNATQISRGFRFCASCSALIAFSCLVSAAANSYLQGAS